MGPRKPQKQTERESSPGPWWPGLVIVLSGFGSYLNSLSGPFVFDDYLSILQNTHIRRWWDLRSVLFPDQDSPFAGRPLVNFSFAINYAIGGLDVRGYHLVNIAVHLVCGLLVYGVVRRTLELPGLRGKFGSATLWLAFATALIWTLHPLNTEAVDYLTERTESLMALFYLLTMYASIRAVGSGRVSNSWPAIAIASCALGMACKESMVTAPLALVLYDRVYVFDSFGQAFRTRWRFYSGLAATWVILLVLMWSNPRGGSAGFSSDVHPWTYLLNQTVMITQYFRHAAWPRSLVVNYGWPLPLTLGDVLPYASLIVLLLVLTVAALIRAPKLGYLGGWVFITLAPTSSIVPIVTEVGAERRMYLPLIGIVALAALAVWTLWKVLLGERRTVAAGLTLGAVSAVLAISTVDRNRDYASGLSLIRTAVERWPSSVSQHILGETLVAAGATEEAIPYLRAAAPGAPRAHLTLGIALFNQGKLNEAVAELETLIRIQQSPPADHPHWQAPLRADVIMARRLMADALLGQQAYDQAIPAYREYLESQPTDADAFSNLGIALVSSGKHDEAIQAFRRSAELAPNDGAVQRNLADALFGAGKVDEAAVHAARAVELRPDDSAARDLLGRALAVQGKMAEAVAEFERALKIDPGNTEARDHLARIRQLWR